MTQHHWVITPLVAHHLVLCGAIVSRAPPEMAWCVGMPAGGVLAYLRGKGYRVVQYIERVKADENGVTGITGHAGTPVG